MPTLQQSIIQLTFAAADPAAAPGGAALAFGGVPDGVDFSSVQVPCTGTIVGISVAGSPAAGDSVAAAPTIGTSRTGVGAAVQASLLQMITNAQPAVTAVVTKDQADGQFSAGQFVGVTYSTATGGTYTPRDVAVVLFISTGRTDI